MALIDKLNAIGEAIRAKTGKSEKLTLDEMPIEIGGITTSEDLDAILTEQEALIDELKEVLQGKAGGGGGATPAVIEPLSVTENGTYTAPDGVDGYSPVSVNVPIPEDELAMLVMNTLTDVNNRTVTSVRSRAFQGATRLKTVNLPNATSIGTYAFYGCSGLLTVNLPTATSIPSSCFYTCTSATRIDLGAAKSIAGYGLYTCQSLKELILRRSDAICTLSASTSLSNSGIALGKGYVYVPSALIDTYKAATNWTTYAAQIRAIEDYPDICGG